MKFNKSLIRMAVLGCLSASITTTAIAAGEVEEIIVTATKRQQTLQEVPVAVSVTSSETIEKAVVQDIQDLQSLIPSLRVTQLQSSTNTNFIIRGFGNGANNAGIEPSVGVFIDGVYRSRSAGAISDLPNLERVEVLRGPQSTLFGKNASAGVISVITQKPQQEFGGSAELTVGNYGLNIIKADVTGGITDNLAFSLNGSLNTRDGYFDNLEGTSDAFNERDRSAVRGQLLYTPTDNTEFRLILDSDSIDENCCGVANLLDGPTGGLVRLLGGNLVPNDPFAYEFYINKPSQSKVDNEGVSLQADINFNSFDLTSITSHRNQELYFDQDADFGSASLLGNVGLDQDIQTITQELRISSKGEGNLDWLAGAFWFKENVYAAGESIFGDDIRPYGAALLSAATGGTVTLEQLEQLASAYNTPNPLDQQNFIGSFYTPGTGVTDFSTLDNEALSLFGQIDWHIGDNQTLTLGLNHTTDEKDVTLRHNSNATFANTDFANIFFNQTFFDSFGAFGAFVGTPGFFPATPTNVGIISAQPAGTFASIGFPGTGAQLLDVIQAGSADAAAGLLPLQFLGDSVSFPNAVENGQSRDSGETTYMLRYSVDMDDNINIYGSYGTGFKASSWNMSRDSRPVLSDAAALEANGLTVNNLAYGTRFAGPEDSTVLEFGLKARFDRGAANFAVFDQSIKGFQSNVFNGTGFNLANAGKQSTTGLEFDALYNATDNLTLTIAGTYLNPRYDSFEGASGVGGTTDLSGTRPAGIHELSTSFSALYDVEFSNGWTGFLRSDYLYESDTPINENVPADLARRQVNTLNASFGVRTQNDWQMTLWGRNITNDQYLLSSFPSVAQEGSYSGYPNQPRTYGLTIRKDF